DRVTTGRWRQFLYLRSIPLHSTRISLRGRLPAALAGSTVEPPATLWRPIPRDATARSVVPAALADCLAAAGGRLAVDDSGACDHSHGGYVLVCSGIRSRSRAGPPGWSGLCFRSASDRSGLALHGAGSGVGSMVAVAACLDAPCVDH